MRTLLGKKHLTALFHVPAWVGVTVLSMGRCHCRNQNIAALMKHSSGLTAQLRGLVKSERGESERGGEEALFNHLHQEVFTAESLLLRLEPPSEDCRRRHHC